MNSYSSASFSAFVDIEIGLPSHSSSSRGSMDFSCSHRRHFLDVCSLCDKIIGAGNDIYMYRGDAPFCSEECRKQQMDMDDAEERRMQQRLKKKNKNNKSPCSSRSSKSAESYVTVTIAG